MYIYIGLLQPKFPFDQFFFRKLAVNTVGLFYLNNDLP